ncbi:hypothetical protein QR98_0039660 [Sarcoptes scabiei]|uniref:Uncharacterized protein n=1 Tax=Sarcoptes scabiei TaxID=52283 RepID=A0A132A3C5_SARSC|nr:hypothetical protein QR98_0039660 [Sarcoptes scabiei]
MSEMVSNNDWAIPGQLRHQILRKMEEELAKRGNPTAATIIFCSNERDANEFSASTAAAAAAAANRVANTTTH